MKTAKQLVEEARELRLSFRPEQKEEPLRVVKKRPNYVYSFFQALAPVGYQVRDCVVHFYYDEYPDIPSARAVGPNITVIVHGHTRTGFCATPTNCRVLLEE